MSRKDYELIARSVALTVNGVHPDRVEAQEAIRQVALNLASALRSTNAAFDADRFLKACGA